MNMDKPTKILSLRIAGCALVASLLGSHAEAASGNPLIGAWSRDRAECAHPELSFQASSASIYVEADGEPTSFKYPAVRYRVDGAKVTVKLGKRHPISKTPEQFALCFVMQPDGRALLQLRKDKSLSFARCPPEASP